METENTILSYTKDNYKKFVKNREEEKTNNNNDTANLSRK